MATEFKFPDVGEGITAAFFAIAKSKAFWDPQNQRFCLAAKKPWKKGELNG